MKDQDFNRFSSKTTIVSRSFLTLMAIYVSPDPEKRANICYLPPSQMPNEDHRRTYKSEVFHVVLEKLSIFPPVFLLSYERLTSLIALHKYT